MNRVLPLKPNPNFQTSCWDASWMAIILSNDKFLPWYIEHFIRIHIENINLVRYYDPYDDIEYFSIYNEILELIPLEVFLKDVDDVISFTKKNIDNGYYVNFTLDLFYIDFAKDYNKNHNFHGPIIFGYSDEKKVFYGYDLLFGINEYKYDQYKAGCESLFRSIREKVSSGLNMDNPNYMHNIFTFKVFELGLHTLGYLVRFKTTDFREKPLLGRIYLAIEKCLEGKIFISENDKSFSKWFGISIYDKLNKDVFSNGAKFMEEMSPESIDYLGLGLRTLVEAKEGLKFRIDYLHNNGIIQVDNDLLNKADFLCNRLRRAFLLFVKFYETKNENYFDTARTIMNSIKEIDREVLEKTSEAIFHELKHGLSP